MAGLRPGFGLGGTIHCLFVSEVGVGTVTGRTLDRPLVDIGARGARALGAASDVGDAILGDADIVMIDLNVSHLLANCGKGIGNDGQPAI